ncbi:kinase-like protein [Auricularia subglabra TFB-10046 SS5]|nr:kinase-like protein [Auricularia subglabra TFB-10046 SS5]
MLQDFYGEVMVWSQMQHPNLLPLLGLCPYEMTPAFTVSWMDGGSCVDFLLQYPDSPRLTIAEQVAAGLTYMHTRTPAIVHGDIRAHTVVFTADGVAQLSNFDFGPQQDPIESFDKSLSFTDGPLRNAAPDFVDSTYAHRTTWSDVYSFAMFMFEVSGTTRLAL